VCAACRRQAALEGSLRKLVARWKRTCDRGVASANAVDGIVVPAAAAVVVVVVVLVVVVLVVVLVVVVVVVVVVVFIVVVLALLSLLFLSCSGHCAHQRFAEALMGVPW
jgi:hypothetical protein